MRVYNINVDVTDKCEGSYNITTKGERMKKILFTALLAVSITAFAAKITDLDNGKISRKVAEAHAEKAVKLIVDKGDKAAFDILSDPAGDWVNGDLYAFVIDFKGDTLAHVKLRGKNIMELKDKDGKSFIAEFVKIAKEGSGKGWSRYFWPKPGDKVPVLKFSYIARVPGKDYFVGVGTYDMTDADMK